MSDLPVRAALPQIADALAAHGAAVLVAPPGTGKTTLVPPALPGRVVVAEPRRIAARAAAARMAALAGEPVGASVGYAVRGDRKVSKDTRIEVVTSGLLVRRLQSDPELSGVDTVLLDECHERHLDADLLLALLLDARDGLRPDLRVLATSATVAADRLADLLDAPVIRVEGAAHPVAVKYVPPVRGERLAGVVARAVELALSEGDGDVLVFLPGVKEIRWVASALDVAADVVVLHGRLPSAEQDAALRPGPRRRVVLATAVAESSLTVPGVRAVVDAGQARVPRVDHGRGLSGLVTVRVSAAVADQRAGRAGREGPGRVYRCWPEHEQSTLPRHPEPEIRTADLTGLALELACWGTPDGSALRWWDAPPAGPLAAARATLTALGALEDGVVTARGRAMSRLGVHPRLARALVDCPGSEEVVAVLDDDTLATGLDLEASLRALRRGSPNTQRWRREVRRLRAQGMRGGGALWEAGVEGAGAGGRVAEGEGVGADSLGSAGGPGEAREGAGGGGAARGSAGDGWGGAGGAGREAVSGRAGEARTTGVEGRGERAVGGRARAGGVESGGGGEWERAGRLGEQARLAGSAGERERAGGAGASDAGEDGREGGALVSAGEGRWAGGDWSEGEREHPGGAGANAGGERGPVGEALFGAGEGRRAGEVRAEGERERAAGSGASDGGKQGWAGGALAGAGEGMQGGGVRPGGEGQGERLGGGGAEQVWRGDERARRGSERAGGGGERVGRADKRTGGGGEQVGRGDEWSGRGGERVGRGEERAGRGGGVGGVGRGEKEGVDVALVVGMAFPERLARRRGGGGRGYLMAGGSAVELPEGMGEPEWVAVAAAEWTGRVGVVRVAAVADEGVALRAGEALVVEEDEVRWRDGDVVARRVRRLGAIVVKERALVEPPAELVQAAVLEGLAKEGLGLVRMGEAAGLRERLALVRRVLGEPWPAVDDDALLAAAPVWAAGVRNAAELRALDMKAVLRGLVPWPEAGRIEELAPERIEVPSGSRIKVDYGADPPALPVKIQEVFGWTASPTVVGGRVPVVLHLLSPAGRPAAVTGDLAGFWREGYHRVRAELRGRYPRHRWPEDPTTAEPTRHTTQRRR